MRLNGFKLIIILYLHVHIGFKHIIILKYENFAKFTSESVKTLGKMMGQQTQCLNKVEFISKVPTSSEKCFQEPQLSKITSAKNVRQKVFKRTAVALLRFFQTYARRHAQLLSKSDARCSHFM